MKRSILLVAAATAFFSAPTFAQSGDSAPVDARQLLEALKQLRDQNETGTKNRRSSAYQQVAAAAASPERAVAFWKEAVKAVQFEGAEREGAQLRDWREADGEALNDRHCANAVRLHLNWLAITLQHASGVETKVLLPKVLDHIAGVQASFAAAEQFALDLEKARDRNTRSPGARREVQEDSIVKRVHDNLARMSVASSPVARWLQLGSILGEGGGGGRGNGNGNAGARGREPQPAPGSGWEMVAGNVDGIYNSVVLPEYRASKDPRLLEYWDMVLKRESDRTAQRKLDVEQRDWNQIKRPALLWARAQDVLLLGYRNKAITEMFNLVKAHPQHPDAATWIAHLETLLVPPTATPTAPSSSTSPSVPAPAPVPPATTPAAPAPGTAGAVPAPR